MCKGRCFAYNIYNVWAFAHRNKRGNEFKIVVKKEKYTDFSCKRLTLQGKNGKIELWKMFKRVRPKQQEKISKVFGRK